MGKKLSKKLRLTTRKIRVTRIIRATSRRWPNGDYKRHWQTESNNKSRPGGDSEGKNRRGPALDFHQRVAGSSNRDPDWRRRGLRTSRAPGHDPARPRVSPGR